mgnify:CR=1 FL=1|jgi:hypothetical protein
MATLPTGGPDLTGGVVYQQQPGLTWKIDQNNRRISGTTDDLEAVRQAVEVILHIERFRWQIYSPYTGVQFDGLIGEDPGYVAAELKRRITEALRMDDRVRSISDFAYTVSGDILTAEMTVNTVYGSLRADTEVTLS